MSAEQIETVCAVLRATCRYFVLPGEKRVGGQVRLVFTFWNFEERKIQRGAGEAWIRRQWERSPEPTVLLGFEQEEFVRAGAEGSLLELEGVLYVELPARASAVQKAIEHARTTRPGLLDAASRERNAADFSKALSGWRHNINNLRGAILGGQMKLSRGESDDTRRQEYAVLADMGPDVVRRSRDGFVRICEGSGMPVDAVVHQKIDEITGALATAVRIWREIKEITKSGFSDERAEQARDGLAALRADFDVIQSTVQGLSAHIARTFGNDSAGQRT